MKVFLTNRSKAVRVEGSVNPIDFFINHLDLVGLNLQIFACRGCCFLLSFV